MKKLSILAGVLFLFVFSLLFSRSVVVKPVTVNDSLPVELVFVMDRSGSMSGFEADTIGGYNTVLKEVSAFRFPQEKQRLLSFNTGTTLIL